MGLFSRLFGLGPDTAPTAPKPQAVAPAPVRQPQPPPLRPIGLDAQRCPYCGIELEKMPGQKRPCGGCGKLIYPRKRPFDGKVVLLREEELAALEEQRAIAYGTYEAWLEQKQRRDQTRAVLREKFGHEPSDRDVNWAILNEESIASANRRQFGLYRNARLAMAQQLDTEGRLGQALELWLEVMCLDLNGASNVGITSETELREMDRTFKELGLGPAPRPFDLQFATPIPAFVWKIIEAAELRGLNHDQLHDQFCSVYRRVPGHRLMPLDAETTWTRLGALLKREDSAARAARVRRRPRSRPAPSRRKPPSAD